MNYFVIGPDGSKYGPADPTILQQWVTENRVTPYTMLEDVSTGQRMPASSIAGLFPYPTTATQVPGMGQPMDPNLNSPYQPNPTYVAYPRAAMGDGGTTWIILSWVFSGIGIVCCPVMLCPVGIVFALVGKSQGSTKWLAPLIFSCCAIFLGCGLSLVLNPAIAELFGGIRR